MPIMTMSGLQSGPTDGDDSSLTHCGLTEPRVLQEATRLHHQCKSAALPFQGTRLKAVLHGGVQEEEREKGTEESTPDDCRLCWILCLSLRRTLCNRISTLKISPLHFFVHLFSHLWKVHNISSLKGAVHASFWSQTITLICYYNCSVVGCSGIGGCFLLVWLWLPQAHTNISLHSTYHYLVMYWFVVGYLVKNVCVCQEGVGWGAHTCALAIFGIGLSCISFYLKWTDLEICTWILIEHFPSNFCSLRKRYILLPLMQLKNNWSLLSLRKCSSRNDNGLLRRSINFWLALLWSTHIYSLLEGNRWENQGWIHEKSGHPVANISIWHAWFNRLHCI